MKKLILFLLTGFHFNVFSQDVKDPLEFRYFGAAGFEITDGETIILLDPYISRIKLGQSSIKLPSNLKSSEINSDDQRKSFKRTDIYESDTILKLMLVIEDVTELEVLEKEVIQSQEASAIKVQRMQEIVSNNKKEIKVFIRE